VGNKKCLNVKYAKEYQNPKKQHLGFINIERNSTLETEEVLNQNQKR
jgi:hypothetical protein